MTTAATNYLREIVDAEPELYLDEIEMLMNYRGYFMSPTTLWDTMTKKLGWTLRLFTSRAKQRDENLRAQYRNALYQIHDPSMFVFIDESSRSRNESRRRRAWGLRGADNSLDAFFLQTEAGHTLLAAADVKGFVVEMCELVENQRGHDDEDPTRGTIDTERFLPWVQEYLIPNLGRADLCEARSVVVLDNAPIHQDERIVRLIEECLTPITTACSKTTPKPSTPRPSQRMNSKTFTNPSTIISTPQPMRGLQTPSPAMSLNR